MRSPDVPHRRRWQAAALPLLTLAALFGMHGLGDHTGAHATDVGHHAMAMASGATHQLASAASNAAAEVTADLPAVAPSDSGATTGATLLCFGVLVGAGLLLLALGRAVRQPGWDAPRLVRQAAPRPHCRDPDPPSPQVLSVFRC